MTAGAADSVVLAGRVLRVEERTAPAPIHKGGGMGGGSSSRQGVVGVGSGPGPVNNKQSRPYPGGGGALSMDRRHTDVGQSLQLLGLGHRMGEVDTVLKAKDKEIERLHYEMMRMTQQQQQQQQQTKGGGVNPHDRSESLSLPLTDPQGMTTSGGDRTVDSTPSSSSSSTSSSKSKVSVLRMATEFLYREASHQDPQTLATLMNEVNPRETRTFLVLITSLTITPNLSLLKQLGLDCGDIDATEAMLVCCMEDDQDTDKSTLKRLAACLKPAPQSLFRKAFL